MLYEGRPANGDRAFRFDKLAVHADAQTARLAVLWPIADLRVADVDAQLSAAEHTLNKWRAALELFRQHAWIGTTKLKSSYQCLRNCYPSSVLQPGDIESRVCKHKDVCPWCYGRWISSIYNTIVKAKTCDEQLVSVFGNAYHPITGPQAKSLKEQLNTYRKCMGGIFNWRTHKYKGVIRAVMVVPAGPQWHFTFRALVLLPLGSELIFLPEKWTAKTYQRPTCDDVKTAVSTVFRYPAVLLKKDVAPLVVEILNARAHLRLTETCGVFRKKLVREQKNANDLHLYAGADGSARSANSA